MTDQNNIDTPALTIDELGLLKEVLHAIIRRRRQELEAMKRVEPPDDVFWHVLDAYGKNSFVYPSDLAHEIVVGLLAGDQRRLWLDVELDIDGAEQGGITSVVLQFAFLRTVEPSVLVVSGVNW